MSERIVATDGHEGHWYTGEEIVRCRDCKRATDYYEGMDVYWCEYLSKHVGANTFCAWGKRRESE